MFNMKKYTKIKQYLFDGHLIDVGETVDSADFINSATKNPTPALNADKVPKLESDGKLSTDFLPIEALNSLILPVAENMDGSTTPVAVCLNAEGNVQKAQANLSLVDKFLGFCTENITDSEVSFVNGNSGTSATLSFTANAGQNRVVLLQVSIYRASGLVAPTGATYNGNAMTLIDSHSNSTTWQGVYRYIIGSNASNDSAVNIVLTGGTYTDLGMSAANYANVHQTTPTINVAKSIAGSGTSKSVTLDPTDTFSKILCCFNTVLNITSWGASQVERIGYNGGTVGWLYFADVNNRNGASTGYSATVSSSTSGDKLMAIQLKSAPRRTSSIKIQGAIPFTGLSTGLKYFLSNTSGLIATTAGTTNVPLGKALSATSLMIIQT
jgi:hypothetical protein